MNSLKQALKETQWVKAALRQYHWRRFSGDSYGTFWGTFASFDEARAVAPKTRPVGFDVPAYAEHHVDRMHKVLPYDYPVLFWLQSILRAGVSIFDFGGNVGVHYYGYRKYLRYPDDLTWTVCELPLLITKGKELAAQAGAPHLRFTESFEDAGRADVLLAAGVLQYIERPTLDASLRGLQSKPQHLFLNKLPMYGGEAFVTLQNAGLTSLPVQVFNRQAFIGSFASLGYELVDEWDVPGFACYVPARPEKAVPTFSGCYLRLAR